MTCGGPIGPVGKPEYKFHFFRLAVFTSVPVTFVLM